MRLDSLRMTDIAVGAGYHKIKKLGGKNEKGKKKQYQRK